MEERELSILGILVDNRQKHSPDVQAVITKYDSLVLGRLGTPDYESNHGLITLNLKGSSTQINNFVNELSQIEGVEAKAFKL